MFFYSRLIFSNICQWKSLILVIWVLPLLFFNSGESSLMAHDEALYAWRSRQILINNDWISPWGNAHHKTPGFYWLIALFYQIFGVSDFTARMPSIIAGILCIFVIYEVGKILLSERLAFWAIAILNVQFLWLQYCRLSTPDISTILLVFIAILYLLKSEIYPSKRYIYGLIIGICFGLGFFMRSFMIGLPIIALLPYLIIDHSRHRHLKNPTLYLGLLLGSIPTFLWLYQSWLRYGADSFGQLLGFVFRLGIKEQHHNGILFYIWNLPLKSFPWLFFAILGLTLVISDRLFKNHLILVTFPIILFTEITLFSTKLSHYSLCLYPFIAFLAAVGLDWLGKNYQKYPEKLNQTINLPRNISYGWGILAITLIVVGIFLLNTNKTDIHKYGIIVILAGLASLTVPLTWLGKHHFHIRWLTAKYWMFSLLFSCWVSLAVAGNLGLLSDFNPQVKQLLNQDNIQKIVNNYSIHFIRDQNYDDKEYFLIHFYTPQNSKTVESINQIEKYSYVWIHQNTSQNLKNKYQIIGQLKYYQLIQLL